MEWEKRTSFVFIKTYSEKAETIYNKIKDWNNTIGVFMTTGPYDLVAWIDTEDVNEAYKWVSEMRTWPEVEWTSTQQTYFGFRNERGYWDWPANGWFKIRTTNLDKTYKDLKNCDYVAFTTSTAGDFDWIGMFYGENYNEIYNFMYEWKRKGYELEYYPTLKYYWNTEYKEKWQEFERTTVKTRTY